ncbi:hypothetical protein [Serratia odorifera]|uniref:DUF3742 domain-containing protein n=2 Tax=Serratia odorifera TaxID=618 RepID=D4E1L2_SEROD|nr:hypothetical protein [Serratia odorifera]EFE96284.1 hypothetical protein HMPREF0758_2062 [Serratia odorifera DSM 4582]HDJ1442328.1 hypothetical protein [Serratia rubidaea]HDJ1451233.1 hypothetical protein [Serratia rubidaea]HDJ2774827.1 hypothetical protein [Serratia rubidaea]
MNNTTQHHAYQRGVRMANLWKRIKGTILHWDNVCVSKARSHKLPGWVGRIPIAIALLGSLTAALLGGLAIAGCLLFIWAIAFILQQFNQPTAPEYVDPVNNESLTEYRDGDQGFGLYCGAYRIDLEDE